MKLNYSIIKFSQGQLVLNGYVVSSNGIRLSRSRLSDIRHMISFASNNYMLNQNFESQKFLQKVNESPLQYRNLTDYTFKTGFQFVQYMDGYRAF